MPAETEGARSRPPSPRGAEGDAATAASGHRDQGELLARLERTAQQLRDAHRLAGLGSFRFEPAVGAFELNDELRVLWGLPPGWSDGGALMAQVHPEDLEQVQAAWRDVVGGAGRRSFQHRMTRRDDGELRHLRVELEGEHDGHGRLVAVRGTHIDVTDLVRARQDLADAQSLSTAVLAASPDVTMLVDLRDSRALWSSGNSLGPLGWTGEAQVGLGPAMLDLVHPDDLPAVAAVQQQAALAEDGEILAMRLRGRSTDGRWQWLSVRLTPFRRDRTGRAVEAVCVIRDVHDAVEAEQRLDFAAHHDALTGLPNRARLLLTLASRSARDGVWGTALLFVDLDHFKRVNDQFGHQAGDAVLVALAQRLQSVLREQDVIARVGGDEFVVLLAGPPTEDAAGELDGHDRAAHALADRLRSVAAEPVVHEGRTHVLSASVGIRLATPGLTAQDALRDADAAMYLAKQDGRDSTRLFHPQHREGATHRAQVEHLLRQALAGGPFPLGVAYQPVYDLASGRLLCFEALARLTGPSGTPVSPEDFIAVAEQTGLIKQLGGQVLAQACHDLWSWRQVSPAAHAVAMAVNLSARQAQDPALAENVLDAVRVAGLLPADLTLELTETSLLSAGLPALSQLRRLRDAGVGIAIDDFGVGYASLRYLATLPVTCLKVDRSFTAGLPHDAVSSTIVRAVAGLAGEMGLTCVVEGIETAEQLAALPAGVHGQGYLLGRPAGGSASLRLLGGCVSGPG